MPISILQTGAAGLVALIVILILRGALVPRRTLRDLLAGRDAMIAEISEERDMWRTAHGTSEAGRQLAEEQLGEMLELSRTATHMLSALPRTVEGVGHAGAAAALDAEASKR